MFIAITAFTCLSCGKEKSKSQGAVFTVNPGKPIVLTASTKIDGVTVKGPWFAFSLSMTNTTDEPITILAFELEVYGVDASGTQQKKVISLSPATLIRFLTPLIALMSPSARGIQVILKR